MKGITPTSNFSSANPRRALLFLRELREPSEESTEIETQQQLCAEALDLLRAERVAEVRLALTTRLRLGALEHGLLLPWLDPIDFMVLPTFDFLAEDVETAALWIDRWNHSTRAPQIVVADQLIDDLQAEALTHSEKNWLGIPQQIITAQELQSRVAQFAREHPLLDITFRIIESPKRK